MAKQLLVQDLKDKNIPMVRADSTMTIEEAFQSRPEFQSTKRSLWAGRLRATRDQVSSSMDRADIDSDAYFHDLEIYPKPMKTTLGNERWDGSGAQNQLRIDMKKGFHERMGRQQLFLYRDE